MYFDMPNCGKPFNTGPRANPASQAAKIPSELSKTILYNSDALTINSAFRIQCRFLDFLLFLYFPLMAPK